MKYGEFNFIDDIRRMFADMPNHDFEGIGDDCSVLPIGNEVLVFTADMLNEGVHFLTDKSSAYQIGYKSLMVNISDVAAMGATPVATLLSLALPKHRFGMWSEEFMRGYYAASERYGVKLIGGDTTKSEGVVCVNVTAIGRAPQTNIKRRSSAQIGDVVVVTGVLGASAAGLRDILSGKLDTDNAKTHCVPEACVEEGLWLGKQAAVRAMMDISDGLASDLPHILHESGVSAVITEKDIPIAQGATLDDALCGGEDYQLLLTIDKVYADKVAEEYQKKFKQPLYVIGRVVASDNGECRLQLDNGEGVLLELKESGFHHF